MDVWIENGAAYPVYNPTANLWCSVFIIGMDADGVVRCVIGAPLGAGSDFNDGYEGDGNEEQKPDMDDDYQ